ncbi:MAG: Ig-like domain-containing protein, partial [Octadecabacter sp.]
MSAINFVVRDNTGNISTGSVAGEGVPASLIVGSGADISLNLTQGQIISYTRQGQALEITLVDGRVITIEGYFSMEGGTENELFLSADGYLTEVDLTQGAGEDYFANYIQDDGIGKFAMNDDLYFMRGADVMLADAYVPADDEVGMLGAALGGLAPALGWGGAAAAAGAAALVAGGGGSSGGGSTLPTVAVVSGTLEGNDHTVNEVDHSNGVDIAGTGTPGAEVEVTIDGHTETTTVDVDGNWAVVFEPADIDTGEYTTPIDVTITNEGGTVTITDTLVVDTIIGVDMTTAGGDDGVINAVEYEGGVTLTGVVTGGDSVVVTIDGVEYVAVVDGSTWTLDVDSSVLGEGEYTTEITITATDVAGNSASSTGTVVVDTVIGVTMDATGGTDGVINATEFAGGVMLSGTVTGGDSVTVTIGGVDYAAVVSGSTWTLAVDSSALGEGEYTTDITVTATDAAGNSASSTGTVVVDTVLDVDMSATGGSDGIINATEFAGGVTLSGAVTGGDSVTVTINGVDYAAVVSGTSWSLDVSSSVLGEGEYTQGVTVTATDGAGNSSSTSGSVVVDTVTSVTVDTTSVGGSDNVVNGVEQGNGVTLTGTAQPGASVVVTFGTVSTTVIATASGTWSASYAAGDVPTGELDVPVTAVATDAAGNTATATGSVTVDTFVNNLELTSNSAGGTDGVVNFDESGESITMAGTVEAGSSVSVNLHGVTMAATVDASGNWTVTYPGGTLPGGEYDTTVTVTATDAAGNTSSLSEPVTVDTVAGDLALSTQPIEIDDVVNLVEQSDGVIINGTATAGLTVTVGLGDATLNVVAGSDGTWSVNFPASMVPEGTYESAITASITDAAGNYKEVSDTVSIDTEVVPFNFSTDAVEGDDIINGAEAADGVVLSGVVEAGSTVMVEFGGQSVAAVVASDGSWSASFPASAIAGGEYTASMTATATDAAGNTSVITDTVVVDTLVNNLTSTDPVEGDNVVNAAEAADGITLGGTVEVGSSVMVTFEGIERAATVDAAGNWTVDFAASEIPGGQYEANVTIDATDANGNTDSITDTFTVDTVAPDAAEIQSINVSPAGVNSIITDAPDGDATITEITSAHQSNELADQDDAVALGSDSMYYSFDTPLPNGSHLVVNETDDAGNSNATFVVLEETGTNGVDLGGLSDFNIGSIDLGYAQDAELTLDLATLEGLSDVDNNLIIHGSDVDSDTVTLVGATDSGSSTVIEGKSYDIYTMGDDAQIFI